jgi:prepilin-type processing-associated H-X9-DG protein
MLLPALNKARERARAISCVNNLKQMGQANSMYRDLYDGYVVPSYYDGTPDDPTSTSRKTYGTVTMLHAVNMEANILWCPSFQNASFMKYFYHTKMVYLFYNGKSNTYWSVFQYAAYGINRYISGKKTSKVTTPSRLCYAADTFRVGDTTRGYYRLFNYYTTNTYWGSIDTRHQAACNNVYLDGHVKAIKIPGQGLRETFTNTYNPYMFAPFRYVGDTTFWDLFE